MRTLVCLLFTLALLAGLGVPATAQSDEEIIPDRRLDIRFILAPGPQNAAELNVNMNEGGSVQWVIRTANNEPILIDLHSHTDDNQVVYHVNQTTTTSQSSNFIAPATGVFSFWMEREELRKVNVHITLSGEFGVHSMQNIEPIEESPAASILLVLTAAGLLAVCVQRRREAQDG